MNVNIFIHTCGIWQLCVDDNTLFKHTRLAIALTKNKKHIGIASNNALIKVSHVLQPYDRGLCVNTVDSDNSNSFRCQSDIRLTLQMVETYCFCESESQWQGGDSDSESQWQEGDSDQQTLSLSESLGRLGVGKRIHFDWCIHTRDHLNCYQYFPS